MAQLRAAREKRAQKTKAMDVDLSDVLFARNPEPVIAGEEVGFLERAEKISFLLFLLLSFCSGTKDAPSDDDFDLMPAPLKKTGDQMETD